ncbi:MAG TPA: YbaK/EbsC family protein [Gaiellaceae bacterium]|nr:YbaK/EbsC family protein [Gaiellaceae bacterium]
MPAWPEPVRRVATFLNASGAEIRIEEFSAGTPTAEAAAEAVGCALGDIVKSLAFEGDGRSALVLVPGDRRADAAKVAAALGVGKVRVATAERVRELTGFEPGAVAPFLADVDAVLLERRLLLREAVWVGAGSPSHMARLEPAELARLSAAAPLDLVTDP